MDNSDRILIVEDDSNSAAILKILLQKAGYDILPIAADGETAYSLVEEHKPMLILMDISLAGALDGIDTIKKIHAKFDIPVVYLTGHTSETIIKRAKTTSPFGFILKPYTANMVLITVEMAFNKARLEKDSKETKLRLATTLGNLPNPIFSLNKSGNVTYVNTAGIQFLDLPIGKILNQNIDGVLPLWEPDRPNQQLTSVFDLLPQDNTTSAPKHVVFRKNGSEHHLYISFSAVKNIYHDTQSYVVSLEDFSERFYADRNNQRLATALKNAHEGVLIVDRNDDDFTILYANQGFFRLLKTSEEATMGHPLSELFCENFNPDILKALQDQQAFCADTPMRCADGESITAQWTLSKISNEPSNSELVITIRDVTVLRKMEESLRQTQKIEAIGRLASGIAHDFNNLLSIINGCSDLALNAKSLDAKTLSYINSIKNAGEKGAGLVRQLMDFSRQTPSSSVTSGENSTAETIDKTLQMLTHYLGDKVSLETRIAPMLWAMDIPANALDQILVNLSVNARDAMPNGGKLQISCENFEGQPEGLPRGEYVKIVVKDSGIGIAPEIQEKIFEPFFTTKPIGKGTGLGLSSVYGLVQHHSGHIQLESAPNRGSSFILYFPTQRENTAPNPIKQADNKRCFMELSPEIEKLIRPLFISSGWDICEDLGENCAQVSHSSDADIYIPKTFTPNTSIQHPYALYQIWDAIQQKS